LKSIIFKKNEQIPPPFSAEIKVILTTIAKNKYKGDGK